jgi:hypothetical protein
MQQNSALVRRKTMKKIVAVTLLVLAFCVAGFADIAREDSQKNKKSIDANFSIRLDANAKNARLIIPKSAVKELRAQLDDLDGNEPDTAAAVTGVSRTQTIVGGLFLTLAIVFGGVWFSRTGKITSKTAAVIALLMVSGAVATLVYANAGPPPETRSITGRIFTQSVHMYNYASGPIKIETTNEPGGVQLIVPDSKTTSQPGEE